MLIDTNILLRELPGSFREKNDLNGLNDLINVAFYCRVLGTSKLEVALLLPDHSPIIII